ncbi:uncharacterized protein LOC121991459 [Zingiber officinale]|uniref:uncharacterized protein LOC121991459 n=1 Tax=Zingiber officinale TaxID=94328 RepID=UPI001C4B9F03|nr:uncharacterized protein LOC121991459 [Zingiber officinale]
MTVTCLWPLGLEGSEVALLVDLDIGGGQMMDTCVAGEDCGSMKDYSSITWRRAQSPSLTAAIGGQRVLSPSLPCGPARWWETTKTLIFRALDISFDNEKVFTITAFGAGADLEPEVASGEGKYPRGGLLGRRSLAYLRLSCKIWSWRWKPIALGIPLKNRLGLGSGRSVEAEEAGFYIELNPRRYRSGKAIFLQSIVSFSRNCAPVAEEDQIFFLFPFFMLITLLPLNLNSELEGCVSSPSSFLIQSGTGVGRETNVLSCCRQYQTTT